MGITNLSSYQRCCHIFFHLLLRLVAVLNVVIMVLILLPLCVLIKDIGIKCRADQLMFVYRTLIYRKTIWGLARSSRIEHRGLVQ
jgi:hypothetical protein